MLPIRVFRDSLPDFWPGPSRPLAGRWNDLFNWDLGTPSEVGFRVDIHEDGDDLVIEAELPGLTRDALEITVEDNVLTVGGEYKTETDEEKTHYHMRERRYGHLSRSFRLPKTADGEKVTAELANGVLTLRIPTREEAKPRKIKVK